MRLLTAHKILIGAALVLALVFAGRSVSNYASTHANSELIYAGASLALAAAFASYLRFLWHR
jgi:hypothetical protein